MADAVKPNQSTDNAAAPADAKTKWWKSLLTTRWLVVFVAVSLVIHSVIFVLVRRSSARPAIPPEYTVGAFNLVAGQPGDTHGVPGKFELHVRFIDDLQSQANAQDRQPPIPSSRSNRKPAAKIARHRAGRSGNRPIEASNPRTNRPGDRPPRRRGGNDYRPGDRSSAQRSSRRHASHWQQRTHDRCDLHLRRPLYQRNLGFAGIAAKLLRATGKTASEKGIGIAACRADLILGRQPAKSSVPHRNPAAGIHVNPADLAVRQVAPRLARCFISSARRQRKFPNRADIVCHRHEIGLRRESLFGASSSRM